MTVGLRNAAAASGALLLFCGFLALGTWQIERRLWKLDLIARVAERVDAPATPVPSPSDWSRLSAASDEYRHVRVTGEFLYSGETQVLAVTELGSGFWILTPLKLDDGNLILINRGFVAADQRHAVAHASGGEPSSPAGAAPVTLTGLLRMTEAGGGFLRHNDPTTDRWYSRDVQAIAAARHLQPIAPFFIDADSQPVVPGAPVGGLTVIAFHNNHLVYAITWYTLALMIPAAIWVGMREERRRRQRPADDEPK